MVEVYKIGKVNIVIGGIGVIINIVMVKLLDNEGFIVMVGVKVVYDIINRMGDDVILEVLIIISYVNDDVIWGVSIVVIY